MRAKQWVNHGIQPISDPGVVVLGISTLPVWELALSPTGIYPSGVLSCSRSGFHPSFVRQIQRGGSVCCTLVDKSSAILVKASDRFFNNCRVRPVRGAISKPVSVPTAPSNSTNKYSRTVVVRHLSVPLLAPILCRFWRKALSCLHLYLLNLFKI